MLSPQQIKEHYESESLMLVKSTMANSGFKNVYLIKKGVHSGKYIACAVNQVDDSTYESLGIFESREQAALQYARHIASLHAPAPGVGGIPLPPSPPSRRCMLDSAVLSLVYWHNALSRLPWDSQSRQPSPRRSPHPQGAHSNGCQG